MLFGKLRRRNTHCDSNGYKAKKKEIQLIAKLHV